MTIISSIAGGAAVTVGSGGTLLVGGVAISVGGVAVGTGELAIGGAIMYAAASNYGSDVSKLSEASSSNKGMNNNRVLKDTSIKGYDVSMDLERGGSGEINVHVKVDNVKYTFNDEAGCFLNSNGNRLPNSLRGNQQIIDGLNKAQDLISKGW